MIQGWSERASASASYNTEVRRRMLFPLEFPVLGAVIGAVVVYSFSRIMLYLSKEAGPIVFIVVASLILAGGIVFAVKPKLSKGFVGGICAVAMLALVGTGLGRQEAYVLVQRNAMRAFAGEGAFRDFLKRDPDVAARLSAEIIDAQFDLEHALAHVDAIVERALFSWSASPTSGE